MRLFFLEFIYEKCVNIVFDIWVFWIISVFVVWVLKYDWFMFGVRDDSDVKLKVFGVLIIVRNNL